MVGDTNDTNTMKINEKSFNKVYPTSTGTKTNINENGPRLGKTEGLSRGANKGTDELIKHR